jgi:beta-N-acetylhexosaminidase
MASGELPWSLGQPIAALVPDTEVVHVDGSTDLAEIARRARGRSAVVVLRDPVRHPWQLRLLRLPPAVVVDVGWPSDLPVGLPAVRTRGVAPGLLAAAALRLAGRVPAELG